MTTPPTPPLPSSAPPPSGPVPSGPTPAAPPPQAAPPATPSPSPSPTSYIGPYRVIRELGAGGMGRVHLAASRSGRAVAVKVVRPELAADPDFRRRFRAEVDAARAVSGAFTAPVVDADPEGPQPWLATAYIPGPSLTEALAAHGPMPEPTLRVLGGGLAEALAAIHRAGLIHRDLKPSNILLTLDGPRVIDFGISRAVDGTWLTAEGQVAGSPGFMSPEQSRGGELTPASDVFAFGAVLAFAATGMPPFGTGAVHALLYRAAYEEPQLTGVPHGLLGIVTACLDKDPARRPAVEQLQTWLRPETVAGWLGAVELRVTEDQRTLAGALRTPVLSRRRLLVSGAVLAATAAAGGTAWVLRTRGEDGGSTASAPELAWTKELPQPGMSLREVTRSTLLCTEKSAGACFDRSTGKLLWKDLAGQNTDALADDGRVYTVRTDGKVYAFDGRSGKREWDAPTGDGAPSLNFSDGELVMVTSGGRFRALEASSGEVRWTSRKKEDVSVVIGATPAGALLTWGSASKTDPAAMLKGYSALDRKTGERVWTKDLVTLYPPDKSTVSKAGKAGKAGKVLYGIDARMKLLALDPESGRTLWSRPTRLPPTNSEILGFDRSLSLLDGTLFCYPSTGFNGSTRGLLVAFDPASGKTLWTVRTTARGNRGYARAGGTVCYLDKKILHGLDAGTGAKRWTAGTGLGDLELLGALRGLFLAAGTKGLYAFHADTGEQVWHYRATGGSGSWSAQALGDDLYAAWSGKLFRFSVPGA
ncbi:PQQ-binding-like beta-propeller repeat protein [Streptomyces formicae]|uniref:Putative serine/threonine protein kinase n=1 Tax=Streptomyces formicae TaxID=1616117 RepID=A0A291QM83_9ACTN|nr:serine/threonine-protein kinase [Streptomyces formicae]ATL32616.1 putative serine/threonine protein kinase [Streptomyces formicae]